MATKPHFNKITRPVSERVRQLQPSGIRRFFDLLATMEDTISLGVGEPDYATPWHIREAAIYSLEKGDTGVGSVHGIALLQRVDGEGRYHVHFQRRYA
jgi:aminotransferase